MPECNCKPFIDGKAVAPDIPVPSPDDGSGFEGELNPFGFPFQRLLCIVALRDIAVEDRQAFLDRKRAHLKPGAPPIIPLVLMIERDWDTLDHCLFVRAAKFAVFAGGVRVPMSLAHELIARPLLRASLSSWRLIISLLSCHP